MKSGEKWIAIATLGEISATAYYLMAEPLGTALVLALVGHCVMAHLCAIAGAVGTASIDASAETGRPRSRAFSFLFLFYLVPALLLPIGGVLTVWAVSRILRSPAVARSDGDSPFATLSAPIMSPLSSVLEEPICGALRQLSVEMIRALATGLRNAQPSYPVSRLLRHLQQDADTEIRFRAQGAVARAIRPAERLLRELSDTDAEQLTERQRLAAADACHDLADWAPATGANRQALLENALAYLTNANRSAVPTLARLARVQLAARRPDDAATSLAQLRVAGASEDLLAPMQAELLYQQRNWHALGEHCTALTSANPEISGAVRFWRAAHLAG